MANFLKKLLKTEHAGVLSALLENADTRELYAGDPSLDWCVKGWHSGGINLIYGPSGSGKSSVAMRSAVDVWKKDPESLIVVFDSEFFYKGKENLQRLSDFGVDPDKVVLIFGNTISKLFDNLQDLEEDIKSKTINVAAIIIDSLGAIQNLNAENKIIKGEAEAAGDAHRGNAKAINPILGVFNRITAEHNIPLFAVQHCIKNQEQYGDRYILIGGERLKFLSQRVLFVEGSTAKDAKLTVHDQAFDPSNPETEIVGKKILAKCVKSRGGMEGGRVEFWFNFKEARFARPEVSLFNLASNLGVIYHPEKDGKVNNVWWAYNLIGKEIKAQGAAKMQELLASDSELFNRVMADCRHSKSKNGTAENISPSASDDEQTA
jgi:RecA/RadA recombinase